ncbi:hypothetical protein [uncultured Acetobacteroides sp.]|nr:hypothetical protein [uncultured Acetobacteroides sp.]
MKGLGADSVNLEFNRPGFKCNPATADISGSETVKLVIKMSKN